MKIRLNNPTIVATSISADHGSIVVHAWGYNENDFNTAMMRLDSGDVLYAITMDEFEELRTRAAGNVP